MTNESETIRELGKRDKRCNRVDEVCKRTEICMSDGPKMVAPVSPPPTVRTADSIACSMKGREMTRQTGSSLSAPPESYPVVFSVDHESALVMKSAAVRSTPPAAAAAANVAVSGPPVVSAFVYLPSTVAPLSSVTQEAASAASHVILT